MTYKPVFPKSSNAKPAAFLSAPTMHGFPLLPSGSPNVLIGGKPAWRAMVDFSTCPLMNGTIPHVGGFVIGGSKTVKINGFSAVRMSDEIQENLVKNKISFGNPQVLIAD